MARGILPLNRAAAVLVVVISLATTGVASGILTQRWAPSVSLAAASQLVALPIAVGDWESRDLPLSAAEFKMTQAAAIDRRWYINQQTGLAATVFLMCGRSGPVSVHVPEVCYGSSGFDEVGSPRRFEVRNGHPDVLGVRRFIKPSAIPVDLTVCYAWSDGGPWQVPENPRYAFAGRPALFKFYVVFETANDGTPETDQPGFELIRALVPLIRTSPDVARQPHN